MVLAGLVWDEYFYHYYYFFIFIYFYYFYFFFFKEFVDSLQPHPYSNIIAYNKLYGSIVIKHQLIVGSPFYPLLVYAYLISIMSRQMMIILALPLVLSA